MALDIVELEVDDGNEAEMVQHGVSTLEMLQLLDSRIVVIKNKKGKAAEYLMIGQTHGGRILTAPIVSTPVEGRWRPATAWEASAAEKVRYRKE